MRNFQVIAYTLGLLLLLLGGAELLPAYMDWGRSPNAKVFLISALICLFFGGALVICNRGSKRAMTARGMFLLTTLAWIAFSFFAAIPLYLSDLDITFVDAIFEIVSGVTTTGSTILVGLDSMSQGVLVWRSLVQWIGGIGIIGFVLVILPFLQVGGMQLLRTESSDKSDKVLPRASQIARGVLFVYFGLTFFIMLTYKILGMNWFDAINHAMTTISTAGYSTHDSSFGYFNNFGLDIAATLFMLMAGFPFLLYVRLLYKGEWAILKDEQLKFFLYSFIFFTFILSIYAWINNEISFMQSLRHSAFIISSIITTTGFASMDYLSFGSFAAMVCLMVTYLGACAGSTAGGIKTMRLIICIRATITQFKRLIHPHGVFAIRYQGKVVAPQAIDSVFVFIGLYVVSNVFFTLLLAAMGLDLATAMSAAATALANVGPGIGPIIGPAGNFASLPDAAKIALSAAMLLGRLELMTIFVLFTKDFWKA